MVLQPCGRLHLKFLDMRNPIPHQGTAEHRHVCPGHNHLDYVGRLINSAGRGEVGANFSVKNPNPMQRQAHVSGYAKCEIWRNLHLLEIDVRLVKSVEQNQPVCAERIETCRDVCEIAKVWAELHRQRVLGSRSYGSYNIDICFFDCTAGNIQLGRYPVDVELQCVGPRLGNLTRVANPASKSGAVQASDNRNFHGALRPPDVFQVSFWPDPKFRPGRCMGFRLFLKQ